MLEQVCTDLDGVSKWYYDAETQVYARYDANGQPDVATGGRLLAHLSGRDIPNPDTMWLSRCQLANVTTSSIEGMRLKPTPTVYSLFEHWQGVSNA